MACNMDDIFEQMLAVPSWGESYGNMPESFGSLPKNFSSAHMLPSSASFDNSASMHCQAFETSTGNAQLNRLVPSLKYPAVGYENTGALLANHLTGAPFMQQLLPNMDNATNATFSSSGDSGLHLGKRSRSDEENFMSDMNGTQHPPIGDQNVLGGAAANGTKGRVRARRGQATDPHSIAERNRRERIAERMKALQELVPDANKTDKASMLDEIINYVKFLQMQVKCLSMCRLGGSGVAGSLMGDFPNEGAAANILAANFGQVGGMAGTSPDGMAFAEQQVAQLMDKDMSSAMQYLQSKGLCLMPISLATAISSSSVKSKGLDPLEADKQSKEAQALIGSSAVQSAVMASIMSKTLEVAASGTNTTKASAEALNDGVPNGKPGN